MTSDQIIATIAAIIASPQIEQYKFGLTLNSPRRRKQYIGVGFEHFAIIDTWLSCDDALSKEQTVFNKITQESDKRSALYRKYHHKSRGAKTGRSLGGKIPVSTDRYDLYIAWWAPTNNDG